MLGNYNRERLELEKTYFDEANIYRSSKVKENGQTKFENNILYEKQACAISKKTLPNNNQSESSNAIIDAVTLFITPEIEIKQGDIVEVTHFGRTHKYIAGEPFVYATHQEILLDREGNA